jgi:hypothetical protein
VTLFFDGVFTVVLPAVDFFNSVAFDSVVFDSEFLDLVALVICEGDLVGVGLIYFPLTILSLAILAVDLVGVGLDFFT